MTAPTPPRRDLSWLARAGFFVVLPGLAVGGAMGAPPVLSLAGLLSLRPSLLREAAQRPPPWLALLLAFVGWAALSTLWSPYSNHSQAIRLLATMLPALLFALAATADSRARRLTRAGAGAAFLCLAGLLAIEALFGLPLNGAAQPHAEIGALTRNPARGVVVLLALCWGVSGAFLAAGRRVVATLCLAVAGALSTQFDQSANLLAFGCGLAAFVAGFALPRLALLAASGAMALWVLAAPWVTPMLLSDQGLIARLPTSWAERVGIWNYTSARIAERPWIGRGMDASHTVTDHIVVHGARIRGIPLHPHSTSLHIWYDTGLVGALLTPEVVRFTNDIYPLSAACFLAASGAALTGFLALTQLRIPRPPHNPLGIRAGRPLFQIMGQPRFLAALEEGAARLPDAQHRVVVTVEEGNRQLERQP